MTNPVLCQTATKYNTDIQTALAKDSLDNEIILALASGAKQHPKVPLVKCTVDNNLVYIYGLLYIPDNETLHREIIHAHHDHPAAGHPGRAATYELVSQNY